MIASRQSGRGRGPASTQPTLQLRQSPCARGAVLQSVGVRTDSSRVRAVDIQENVGVASPATLVQAEPERNLTPGAAAAVFRSTSWDVVTATFGHSAGKAWRRLGLHRDHGPARGRTLVGRRLHFARGAREQGSGIVAWVDRECDVAESLRGFQVWPAERLDEWPSGSPSHTGRMVAVRHVEGPRAADDFLDRQLGRVGGDYGDLILTRSWLLRFRLGQPLPGRGYQNRMDADGATRGPVLSYCAICHQPLTDSGSALLGIGPECRRRLDPSDQQAVASGVRATLSRLAVALLGVAPAQEQ